MAATAELELRSYPSQHHQLLDPLRLQILLSTYRPNLLRYLSCFFTIVLVIFGSVLGGLLASGGG